MQIGKRIYYDISTGDVILDTGERQGSVVARSIEKDVQTYKALSERNRETFDVLELPYGQYAQDFGECNGYRVNPDTLELEFSYPDPNLPPDEQDIIYRTPLSVEVEELKTRQDSTEDALLTLLMTI